MSGIETGDVSDDGDSCSDLDENIGASTEREGGDDYEWIRLVKHHQIYAGVHAVYCVEHIIVCTLYFSL